jgi:endonuclease/exonuclease/phosphatase family metal-dependent hydrolase
MSNRTLHFLVFLVSTACGGSESPSSWQATTHALKTLAPEDRFDTLDVMSWNVEWLGAPNQGPRDDALQVRNVQFVLSHTAPDIVGLVEVVQPTSFEAIVAQLPGHRGILASDSQVQGGSAAYGPGEQKPALLFSRRFSVERARVILVSSQAAFAGRPPLEVVLTWTEDGTVQRLGVIVVHLKAFADRASYEKRQAASLALKDYLDSQYTNTPAIVIGDFNDDIDVSIYRKKESPFRNFLSAQAAYRFATERLTIQGVTTTTTFRETIDHHLVTPAFASCFLDGSAKTISIEEAIAESARTTSDHLPVLTRYQNRTSRCSIITD